ncbi:MAG: AraC family transcriptional regulator [Bacteroidota bacterium]
MTIFIYSLAILGMFMTLILSVFFLITPKGNKPENRILSALILVFGFQIFISLALGNYGLQYFIRPHLFIYVFKLTSFLSGPLMYYYIKAFLSKNKSIRFNLIHFVPFFCSLIFFGYFRFDVDIIGKTTVYVDSFCLLQNLAYIAFSIHCIKKSKIQFRSLLHDFKDLSVMHWMRLILLGYIMVWIVQLNSLSIYVILNQTSWCAYTGSILALVILIFTLLIMFLLLLKPGIYHAIKYKSNNLDELSKAEYLQRVNEYFQISKPHLDPDISLEKVANDISINPRLLSQVINELCKTNFKGFVNDLRIKECVRLFSEDSNNEKTIQEVYYMAGFSSKSVFNELFKAKTGLTPKEFKDRVKKSRFE